MEQVEYSVLSNTLGALLIGIVITAALYGLTTLQTYQYFRTSSADPYLFKATIFLLWILDTVHEVLIVQSLWTYVIVDFGNTTAINTPTKPLLPDCLGIHGVHPQKSLLSEGLATERRQLVHGCTDYLVFHG